MVIKTGEEAEREFITMLNGSEEGFSLLFKRFYPGLIRYAAALLPCPNDESADIVSDVFATLWNSRKNIKIQGSVSSYIYIAVKNRVYDHIKKKKLDFKELNDDELNLQDTTEPVPDQLLMLKEVNQRIIYLINKLPDRTRLIFQMNRNENLTYNEIAEILNISVNTVKTQMYRSLKFLNQAFYAADKSNLG
ncbi:MAG TPA: RNA polymerase sigma-70 factor [Mucilaginibacter sp.]|jgi:RNA polymerase sigma-70 factor (ECF subfamily)